MSVWWWVGLGFSALAVGLALAGYVSGGFASLGISGALYAVAITRSGRA